VYEIYKVGEDIHWKPGLDFFGPFGLKLVIIPHWDNQDGGEGLDTSRCFMGQARFRTLEDQLPPDFSIVGIDEQTGLILDLAGQTCRVVGRGAVSLKKNGFTCQFKHGEVFSVFELGDYRLPLINDGVPVETWLHIREEVETKETLTYIPQEVLDLIEEREIARLEKDWRRSDELREKIAALGWLVQDTQQGPRVEVKQDSG
jgi:hypothetical protein